MEFITLRPPVLTGFALTGFALTGLALAACPGEVATTAATEGASSSSAVSTDTSTTGGVPTTGAIETTEMTTGTTAGASTEPAGSSSTTGPDIMCSTLLCGDPLACCAAGEECVASGCLPACATGVRCGADLALCCADGEVCVGDQCVAPVGPCGEPFACGPGEFCEPELGQCLPQPGAPGCAVLGKVDGGAVVEEWAWTASEVSSVPLVADVDDDGAPDVIVNALRVDGKDYALGEIVLLDGKTGAEKWRIVHAPDLQKFGSQGRSTVVVADVSGDGVPDIIYAGREDPMTKTSPVHAVDGSGALLWTARLPDDAPARLRVANGALAAANFDDDPEAEIVIGAAVLDHDGLMVWNEGDNGGQFGTPLNNGTPIYFGGLATIVDLDGDDRPEIVTGREAWKVDWAAGDPPTVKLSMMWTNTDPGGKGNDGWPAVADLDGDGDPEVVLTAWPTIRVLDGKTGKLWCGIDPTDAACSGSMANEAKRTQPISIKGGNLGGPATIADFDGDGRPEAGIAGGVAYAVYDFNRKDEEIVKLLSDPDPAPGAMYARWMSGTQDSSSASTGSAAFDLTGDGRPEVVYNDECAVRVYDGKTGQVLLERPSSSATIHEYPIVVDVDADGDSEFIVVANLSDDPGNTSCKAKLPGFVPRKGVFAYGPGEQRWATARRLWTQHTYHVTNATPSGHVPLDEQDHWTVPGVNSFRHGVAAPGSLNAPDLTVSLAADLATCPAELRLVATVFNKGDVVAPPGLAVTFYEGVDDKGAALGVVMTNEAIVPGGSAAVTWTVAGAAAATKTNYHATVSPLDECYLGNNAATLPGARCPE